MYQNEMDSEQNDRLKPLEDDIALAFSKLVETGSLPAGTKPSSHRHTANDDLDAPPPDAVGANAAAKKADA
eukprot:SAG22_NODE_124_length_18884_cov_34.149367_11_plen_71_part_00